MQLSLSDSQDNLFSVRNPSHFRMRVISKTETDQGEDQAADQLAQ